MRIIPIGNINEHQLHLTENYILFQHWNDNTYSFMESPRARSGFTLYLQGSATYVYTNPETDTTESLHAAKGDLIFLPINSRYSVTFHPEHGEPVLDYLLQLRLYDGDFQEIIFSKYPKRILRNTPSSLKDSFAAMRSLFRDTTRNTCQLQASAFRILHEIASLTNAKSIAKQGYALLLPGIAYMENHLLEDFSIAELAQKCNVSETYFRRKFKEYMGKTPLQYKNDIIMQKAMLLMSSKTLSIQEISEFLGFCDCTYFCKVFKKSTGLTTSEYLKTNDLL